MPSAKMKTLLLHVAILLLPFGLLYWIVPGISEQTLGNDYTLYAAHEELELQSALRHGDFPLFIPGFACGRDVAALTLGRLYHPLPHLAARIPGYFDGAALDIVTVLRIVGLGLAHLLLFVLLSRLGIGRAAAFIISLITVYNQRMLDLFRYGASIENYTAHLFLIAALGFHFLYRTRIKGPLAVIAATYLLITGGHPQMMYFGLLAAGFAAVVIPFALPAISPELKGNRADTMRYYEVVGLSMLGGIALASAYIVPFLAEFLFDNAIRVNRSYAWSLSNSDNLGGALGNFFFAWRSDVHGAFGGSSLFALVLALPILRVFKQRPPKIIWVLLAAFALVFVIGLGRLTPLHFWFWKLFPMAGAFRTPGRITMLLPSISMFLLAYLFSRPAFPISIHKREFQIAPLLPSAALSLALFGLYFALKAWLPAQARWVPAHIHPRPAIANGIWIVSGIVALVSAMLLGARTPLRRTLTAVFCLAVVLQVGMTLRFGTWSRARKDTRTYAEYLAGKTADLKDKVTAGYGMESSLITLQLKHSSLEPKLAKLYRKYVFKSSDKAIWRYLAKKRRADTAAILGNVSPPPPCAAAKNDVIRLTFASYNALRFEVTAECGGLLSLSFPFSENWQAAVNGTPVEIYKANGYETAVLVPKGKGTVSFAYRSTAHVIGRSLSACTILIIALLLTVPLRRSRPRTFYAAVTASLGLAGAIAFGPLYRSTHPISFGTKYRWTTADLPSSRNLAYAKRTRMSPMKSDENPYYQYSGRAVDGDRVTKGFITNPRRRGFWQVDLGKKFPVRRILVFGDNKKTLPLTVSASKDGKAFTPIYTIEKKQSAPSWQIDVQIDARYIRLERTEVGILTLKEVEVYGP